MRRRRSVLPVATGVAAAVVTAGVVAANSPSPDAAPRLAETGTADEASAVSTPAPMPTTATSTTDRAPYAETPAAALRTLTPSPVPAGVPRTQPPAQEISSWRIVDWRGTLPQETPTLLTANVEHIGAALFSSDTGALVDIVAVPADKHCSYAPPTVGRGGWLYFAASGAYGSGGVDACEQVPYGVAPDGEVAVVVDSPGYYGRAAHGPFEVRLVAPVQDGPVTHVRWMNGDEERRVESGLPEGRWVSELELSPHGRLAVTFSERGRHDRVGLLAWGESLADAALLAAPGGDDCRLSHPGWYTGADSVGEASELVFALQTCGDARRGWDSWLVLLDPWRQELLWEGSPLPRSWAGESAGWGEPLDPSSLDHFTFDWLDGVALMDTRTGVYRVAGDSIEEIPLHDPGGRFTCALREGTRCWPGEWLAGQTAAR